MTRWVLACESAPMAMAAIFAFALFWSASTQVPGGVSDVALLGGASDAGIEEVVFADTQSPSSDDDVLATIMNDDDREATR